MPLAPESTLLHEGGGDPGDLPQDHDRANKGETASRERLLQFGDHFEAEKSAEVHAENDARGSEEDRKRGLSLGASGYIVKPFKGDELQELVKNVLGA